MRKIDIAHSGQTVAEALAQLVAAIRFAQRDGEEGLLVVHGFGKSGVGGLIKDALVADWPRLATTYSFKVYGDADRARIPRELKFDSRRLNQGSSLLVFRKARLARDLERDFRPNFRNLKRVKVPPPESTAGRKLGDCAHVNRQLLSRGPSGSTYRCRTCGRTFLVYS
ncbi:MAG TPA: Smr/MutS family protein [Patescibacteria group bacterium]|nr:Smr/MutS family protein [Patescibacteria group bacterium]